MTSDRVGFLDQFLRLLTDAGARYCVVGGQAVNAYVEPVVSLDLDVVVALPDLERVEAALKDRYSVVRFPHSVNVSAPGSDLRIQLQTDSRYGPFVDRAQPRPVLGLMLPVARIEDVLQGKVWAAQDPSRRGSKRLKDLADIARLVESRPDLRERVPADLLARLI